MINVNLYLLFALQFDGKGIYEAILHNMKELAKFITIISAIGHFLITFCKVGHETGEEVGTKVFEEAIVSTDSLDTMLVLQTGNLMIFCNLTIFKLADRMRSMRMNVASKNRVMFVCLG